MGEMPKLCSLIGWCIRDTWADSLYFLYVVFGITQRIYLSGDDIYSDSTLVLGLIRVEFFLTFLMFVLTLADGLCCA
jgi:hypothetical protein